MQPPGRLGPHGETIGHRAIKIRLRRPPGSDGQSLLSFEPDADDSVGLLRVVIEPPDFGGADGFWAQSADIEAFAKALAQCPLPASWPPCIRLGYNGPAGDDLRVGVAARPAREATWART